MHPSCNLHTQISLLPKNCTCPWIQNRFYMFRLLFTGIFRENQCILKDTCSISTQPCQTVNAWHCILPLTIWQRCEQALNISCQYAAWFKKMDFAFTQTAYLPKLVIPTTNARPHWRLNVETKTKPTVHSRHRLSFNELTNAKSLVLHSSHFALNWRCCTAVH